MNVESTLTLLSTRRLTRKDREEFLYLDECAVFGRVDRRKLRELWRKYMIEAPKIKDTYPQEYKCTHCGRSVVIQIPKGEKAPQIMDKPCPECGCRELERA